MGLADTLTGHSQMFHASLRFLVCLRHLFIYFIYFASVLCPLSVIIHSSLTSYKYFILFYSILLYFISFHFHFFFYSIRTLRICVWCTHHEHTICCSHNCNSFRSYIPIITIFHGYVSYSCIYIYMFFCIYFMYIYFYILFIEHPRGLRVVSHNSRQLQQFNIQVYISVQLN